MATGTLAAGPAQANGTPVGITVISTTNTQIQIGLCVSSTGSLPARLTGNYSIRHAGSVIASGDLAAADPNSVLISAEACPSAYVVVNLEGLTPSTAYVVEVSATLTPKKTDIDGLIVDDPARAAVVGTDTRTVTTEPNVPDSAGTVDPEDAEPSATPSPTPSPTPSATPGSTPGATPAATPSATPALEIPNPAGFRPAQLAILTPSQIATIDPAVFGQFPPATFKALTAAQAAAVTPEQASAIRPARAANLRPAAVTALEPVAVAAMRPAAIRSLRPDAVKAMRRAQLKALTARQVGSLSPEQLAALSNAQKALLTQR